MERNKEHIGMMMNGDFEDENEDFDEDNQWQNAHQFED